MAWVYLVVAGLFEMIGVGMINRFHHKRDRISIILLVSSFGLSFLFLSFGMFRLPMGTAYAVWTGIGAGGGALVGMLFYGESRSFVRICCIGLILGATIGLKWIE